MKQRFIAGDTIQVGEDGKYEAGIHDTQGDHQGRKTPETWWQRIIVYGDTAKEAEELRGMVLSALSASPAPSGEVEAVEVVAMYHKNAASSGKAFIWPSNDTPGSGREPIMTIAQHQRIVAAKGAELEALHALCEDRFNEIAELRAQLATQQGVVMPDLSKITDEMNAAGLKADKEFHRCAADRIDCIFDAMLKAARLNTDRSAQGEKP